MGGACSSIDGTAQQSRNADPQHQEEFVVGWGDVSMCAAEHRCQSQRSWSSIAEHNSSPTTTSAHVVSSTQDDGTSCSFLSVGGGHHQQRAPSAAPLMTQLASPLGTAVTTQAPPLPAYIATELMHTASPSVAAVRQEAAPPLLTSPSNVFRSLWSPQADDSPAVLLGSSGNISTTEIVKGSFLDHDGHAPTMATNHVAVATASTSSATFEPSLLHVSFRAFAVQLGQQRLPTSPRTDATNNSNCGPSRNIDDTGTLMLLHNGHSPRDESTVNSLPRSMEIISSAAPGPSAGGGSRSHSPCVTWTPTLHSEFDAACDEIGIPHSPSNVLVSLSSSGAQRLQLAQRRVHQSRPPCGGTPLLRVATHPTASHPLGASNAIAPHESGAF